MSGRNYSYKKGPLGKFRRSVETPLIKPEVNIEGLLEVGDWRAEHYRKAILDDLLGYYRFEPVTSEVAYTYAGGNAPYITRRAVGQEAAQAVLGMDRAEIVAAAGRQIIHTAENTDRTLGLFFKVAKVRSVAIESIVQIIKSTDPRGLPADIAAYAAGSIVDFGLCLEEPYDRKDEQNPGHTSQPTVLDELTNIAPNIGREVAAFGAFAIAHPEALETYEGTTLLVLTHEEQGYRMAEWSDRRDALAQAFPGVTQDMRYLDRMSLEEMLRVQSDLAA